jgi:hypothetical protein
MDELSNFIISQSKSEYPAGIDVFGSKHHCWDFNQNIYFSDAQILVPIFLVFIFSFDPTPVIHNNKLAIRRRQPNYNDDLKLFFLLRFKFDFFVITLFDITFSLLNGHDACVEDVYSRNTGLFPFMSQSSC